MNKKTFKNKCIKKNQKQVPRRDGKGRFVTSKKAVPAQQKRKKQNGKCESIFPAEPRGQKNNCSLAEFIGTVSKQKPIAFFINGQRYYSNTFVEAVKTSAVKEALVLWEKRRAKKNAIIALGASVCTSILVWLMALGRSYFLNQPADSDEAIGQSVSVQTMR